MPELHVHIQSSLKRTGKEYREVHEWIDNMETKYERHDLAKVLPHAKKIAEQYGDEAAQEMVMHLVEDINCRFNKMHKEHFDKLADGLKYFGAATE